MELRVVNTFLHFAPERSTSRRSLSESPSSSCCSTPCSRKSFDDGSTCAFSQRSTTSTADSDSEESTCESLVPRWADVEESKCGAPAVAISLSQACGIELPVPNALPHPGILSIFQSELARLQSENLRLQKVAAEAVIKSSNSECVPGSPIRPRQIRSAEIPFCQSNCTSIMMRNIPNCFSRGLFMRLLDDMDMLDKCDFIYLPIDPKTQVNRGYAFLNLTTTANAESFWGMFHRFCDWSSARWSVPSRKICSVSWCVRQGRYANVEYLRKCPSIRGVPDEYKPVVSVNGDFQCFP